jgi:hypothetical protein
VTLSAPPRPVDSYLLHTYLIPREVLRVHWTFAPMAFFGAYWCCLRFIMIA